MSTLHIDLDKDTSDALTSLATARGTEPADLVAEIVTRYVKIYEPFENGDRAQPNPAVPDPLDALVGSIDCDPVDDIDEVIYGRQDDPLDVIVGSMDIGQPERRLAPPDSMDALVGRYDAESGDIDEVVYGR